MMDSTTMTQEIYLDWAATAKPNTEENLRALEIANKVFANPSAKHRLGKKARECLEQAREKIAALLGVAASQVFFTSGGTESDHIAILTNLTKSNFEDYSIAVSAIEHAALTEECVSLKKIGLNILTVPCNESGIVTPEAVVKTIRDNTTFLSVMTVNNETGSIQPIADIARVLKEHAKRKIHFHTDAVQAIGKTVFNIADLGVDSLSLSAHKIGALRGTGILFLKQPTEVFNRGGNQEHGVRSGTENLAGVLSLQFALEKYERSFQNNLAAAREKVNFLLHEISKREHFSVVPKSRTAQDENFSPYIVQIAHAYITGEMMVRVLSDRGVFVSTGSACSSAKVNRPVLQAMCVDKSTQTNAFRISFGNETTREELQQFLDILSDVDAEFSV